MSDQSALLAAASAGSSQPLTASLFFFSCDEAAKVALLTLQLLPEFANHPNRSCPLPLAPTNELFLDDEAELGVDSTE